MRRGQKKAANAKASHAESLAWLIQKLMTPDKIEAQMIPAENALSRNTWCHLNISILRRSNCKIQIKEQLVTIPHTKASNPFPNSSALLTKRKNIIPDPLINKGVRVFFLALKTAVKKLD